MIDIGENTYINKNCYLRSNKSIIIGDECTLGWNNTLNTCDGHPFYTAGVKSKEDGDIIIGKHCWITTNCIIGKNVTIPENNVVAQKSLVTTSFKEKNCLIGGVPAKCIKSNVNWEK